MNTAQQGTDAHSLCEHKLKLALGMETTDPTESLSFYDEEMEECACGYAEYVLSLVEEANRQCGSPRAYNIRFHGFCRKRERPQQFTALYHLLYVETDRITKY